MSTTWEQYQNGLAYQKRMGFTADFPKYVDFKEGNQWPAPTERTKNMPRPVFNIVDMFVRTKRAAVLNQPIAITYSPGEISADEMMQSLAAQGAQDLTDYCKRLWKSLKQDTLNAELVDDAATVGTGVLHYYYDMSVTGGMDLAWRGEIRGETIDPLNFFPGNPQERDVQKQPWIIVSQRVRVAEAEKLAKRFGVTASDIALLKGDDSTDNEGYTAAKTEVDSEKKITLLIKYYKRDDGRVYYERCTEKVTICKDICLTPDGSESQITLYPFVVFNWYIKKKCTFGRGEVQTMIPAQKAVNFLKAMELLSVQQTAWPKTIAKYDAIKEQRITNEPGEVLKDYSQNGQGFYYLSPPVLSNAASALATSIIDMMRMTSGVSEATTGESMGASMAASAIIALQAQAKTPIEEVQKRFWLAIEDVGAIWAQFIKAYYRDERAFMRKTDAQEDERRVFRGASYSGIEFDMTVDVGASSEYGEVLAQSTLDMMLQRGDITIDQYVELAPRNVVPFKEQFKQMREQSGQAARAAQEQAAAMAQAAEMGMPLPDSGEGTNAAAIQRPAGVGGMTLPAVPTAPSPM